MSNYKWVAHPRRQSCLDAEQLNGKVNTLEGWKSLVTPGSTFTQCGGNCNCSLIPVDDDPTDTNYRIKAKTKRANLKPLASNITGALESKPITQPTNSKPTGSSVKGEVIKIR